MKAEKLHFQHPPETRIHDFFLLVFDYTYCSNKVLLLHFFVDLACSKASSAVAE